MNTYYMLRSFDHAGYYETRSVLMILAIVVAVVFLRKRGDNRYLIMLISGIFWQAAMEYYLQVNGLRGAGYSLSVFGMKLTGIAANVFQGFAEGGILSLMAFWFVDLRANGTSGNRRESRNAYLALCALVVVLACFVGAVAAGRPISSPRPMFSTVGMIRLSVTVFPALLLIAWKRAWRELGLFYVGLLIYVLITFEPMQILGARYIGERAPDGKFFAAPLAAQFFVMMASNLFEVVGGKIHYFAVPLALGLLPFRREPESESAPAKARHLEATS
jgi:hypothetical protein